MENTDTQEYIRKQLANIEAKGYRLSAVALSAKIAAGNLYRIRSGAKGCDAVTSAKLAKWCNDNHLDFSFGLACPDMAELIESIGYRPPATHSIKKARSIVAPTDGIIAATRQAE